MKGREPVTCYDYQKCVAALMRDGLDEEDAEEWMEFNVVDAYVGPRTPAFLVRYERDADDNGSDANISVDIAPDIG